MTSKKYMLSKIVLFENDFPKVIIEQEKILGANEIRTIWARFFVFMLSCRALEKKKHVTSFWWSALRGWSFLVLCEKLSLKRKEFTLCLFDPFPRSRERAARWVTIFAAFDSALHKQRDQKAVPKSAFQSMPMKWSLQRIRQSCRRCQLPTPGSSSPADAQCCPQ